MTIRPLIPPPGAYWADWFAARDLEVRAALIDEVRRLYRHDELGLHKLLWPNNDEHQRVPTITAAELEARALEDIPRQMTGLTIRPVEHKLTVRYEPENEHE